MKQFPFFLLSTLLLLASCSDEEQTDKVLSADEASAQIHSLASTAASDINSMIESDGMGGVLDLIALLEGYQLTTAQNPRQGIKAQTIELYKRFTRLPQSAKSSQNQDITLVDIQGLYEWKDSTQTFEMQPADLFIVRFPADSSTENNAEFTISDLSLLAFDMDYLPEVVVANLTIDGVEVMNFELDVTWSGDGLPATASIALNIHPFSYTLGYDNLNPTSSSLLSSLTLEGEEIFGIDVDVEYADEFKIELALIEGYVRYYNLKLEGEIEAPSEEGSQDAVLDLNEIVDVEVLLDEQKVGDIVFIGTDMVPYIQYLDGTTEELESLILNVLNELGMTM